MKKLGLLVIKVIAGITIGIMLFNIFIIAQIKISEHMYGNDISSTEQESSATEMTENAGLGDVDGTDGLVDESCSWAASGTQVQLCMESTYKYKQEMVERLYTKALETAADDDAFVGLHDGWITKRNACYTADCMNRVYGERLRQLSLFVNERLSCSIDGIPLLSYRHGFTPQVKDREPVKFYSEVGPEVKSVTFFSEILGGRGSTIYHSWYKDGTQVARVKFDLGGDRWRVWSTKRVDPSSAKWEVYIEDDSGCILKAYSLPSSMTTVMREDPLRGGWYNPGNLFNRIIAEKDDARLSFIKELSRTTSGTEEYFESRTDWGDTPLLLAVRVNNTDAVKLLLSMGASPYVWDASEKSALQLALELGHSDIVDLLNKKIEQSIPPWGVLYSTVLLQNPEKTSRTSNPVSWDLAPITCITKTYGLKGRELRHEWGALDARGGWRSYYSSTMTLDNNVSDAVSEYLPVAGNQNWKVKVFVDNKSMGYAQFRTENSQGNGTRMYLPDSKQITTGYSLVKMAKAWTPIEMMAYVYEKDNMHSYRIYHEMIKDAVASGHIGLVKYLFGKNEISSEMFIRSPLVHHAIEHDRHALLIYLLSMGMNIDQHNNAYSNTPLHIAARENDPLATQMLLEWGAESDSLNQGGMTPLQNAFIRCAINSGRVLLEKGARLSLPWKGSNNVDELTDRLSCSNKEEWKSLLNQYKNEPVL
jgi:hypothetical protein